MSLNFKEINELFEIRKGKKAESDENGEKNYITISNLHEKAYDERTNSEGVEAEKDDVLIAWDGANAGLVGVNFEGIIGSTLARLRLKSKYKNAVNSFYIYRFLESKFDYIKSKRTGATIPHVNGPHLRKMKIPLPPIKTQKSIAARLDQAEAVKQLNQQLLAKYDELAQSLFLEMFGEYINNKKTSLSDLIKINPRKSELKITNENLKVSFIPMSNVGEKGEFDTTEIREYGEVNKGYTYFKENDVLFAKITPCMENGKGAIAKNLKNQIGFGSTEFHVLRPNENLNSQFLYYLLALDSVRKFAEMNMTGSAGQKRVPTDFFQKMKLSKPPLSLQTEFAHRIENIEHQKSLLRLEMAKSEELFESLLQESFSEKEGAFC